MSSANSNTPPEIFTTTSNSHIEDDFAQTKEDFDISSIPDSDSEDGVTIYYQTPDPKNMASISNDTHHQAKDTSANSVLDNNVSFQNLNGDDTQGQELLEATTPFCAFIPSRFSTPTTDELIKYINDTGLLGDDHDEFDEKSPTTSHQNSQELARIRAVITRHRVPGASHTAQNSPEAEHLALTEVQDTTTHLPPGTPLIRDFAIPLLPSIPIPILRRLSTPQSHRCRNILECQALQSHTYPSASIRTMYHYHEFHFRHTINNIHTPSDDKEEEELQRELSAGEEADDEEYMYISGPAPAPPRTPILGNRDQNIEDLAKIEEIGEIENEGLFQIVPRHLGEVQWPKEKDLTDSRIGKSPIPTIIPPLTIPIQSLQQLQPPRINPWPLIALAHRIPLFPTHILTTSSLTQLSLYEKHLQHQNGYTDSPLDQWALTQHRLFLWINSGALENGIDGEMRRPGSADILLGDEVYDFCGEEEILHRSVSVVDKEERKYEDSSSSSYISEEYDASDERGEVKSLFLPLPLQNQNENKDYDPRLGRVVNIFRTRALERQGITYQNSPLRQPINHAVFRETGIQAVGCARANAMARFERIAENFVRSEEAEESAGDVGQLVLRPERDSGFDGAEVHMRGGAGAGDFWERGVML
ncbi:uncharacterized protein Bfra_012042 [Botrytis fragariae]|uniref:Uncharacterized protein n=1 Tax=Botrytis fragariae TaxID=1964551 RepID=A0A8H6EE13_9HELO|nr:uncharacterized protein Bfra_012042 [Botrytis fragariae]KAF5868711.1 hypothetical protein Bfra_012042 [Botrytis fragariae]